MSTKKKTPAKKPRKARRGKKPGPPSTAEVLGRALDDELTTQMQRTGKAVFAQIEKLAGSGKDIPIALLGAARLCAEWHTDYLTVKAAMPDVLETKDAKEST